MTSVPAQPGGARCEGCGQGNVSECRGDGLLLWTVSLGTKTTCLPSCSRFDSHLVSPSPPLCLTPISFLQRQKEGRERGGEIILRVPCFFWLHTATSCSFLQPKANTTQFLCLNFSAISVFLENCQMFPMKWPNSGACVPLWLVYCGSPAWDPELFVSRRKSGVPGHLCGESRGCWRPSGDWGGS